MSRALMSKPGRVPIVTFRFDSCWTCKRRRVVCDSQRPSCKKCLDKGIECLGYGPKKPLVWVQGGRAKRQRREKQDVTTSSSSDTAASDHELKDRNLVRIRDTESGISRRTLLGEFTSWIRAFEYYNQNIAPVSAIVNAVGSKQYIPLKHWHYLPPLYLDIVTLLSWKHRRVRARLRAELLDPFETRELELSIAKRSASAFGEVNRRLGHMHHRNDDFTLYSILTLFVTELLHPSSGNWKPHLRGLRTLINLRGGLSSVLSAAASSPHLLAAFVLAEVLIPTTMDLRSCDEPNLQGYYLEFIPSLLEGSLWTFFPCPVELICIMARANDIRFRLFQLHNAVPSSKLQAEIRDLFNQLSEYSPEKWAKAAAYMQIISNRFSEQEAFVRGHTLPPESEVTENATIIDDRQTILWGELASSYHCAVFLFFLRALVFPHIRLLSSKYMGFEAKTSRIKGKLLARLFESLDNMFHAKDGRVKFHWFSIWPLLVSGIEVDPNDERRKRVLLERFDYITKNACMESYWNAPSLFENHWTLQLQGLRHPFESWDTVFEGLDPLML